MLIQDTIFYRPDWRWHNFLKYLTSNLIKYNCIEKIIPSEYSYRDATYGSKKSKKNVNLSTWGVTCLLYTSPSPRDTLLSRMPSSA